MDWPFSLGSARMATMNPPPRLSAVSVFSGAGGLDLGSQRAGVEVVFATDAMAEAEVAYRTLMPDVKFQVGDVRKLVSVPSADLLLGGYPCQPFTMGGPRRPAGDHRSDLYLEFARCLKLVRPQCFVAENVPGLYSLGGRAILDAHLSEFAKVGEGYVITFAVVRAEEHGVPQRRRRLFMVGVRRDLERYFHFPQPDHTADGREGTKLFAAHGEVLAGLPEWPTGEFYERPDDEGHWPWYYMSRNRKARWDDPSYTIIANARHTPIHPASPMMRRAWSQLSDGFKQGWEFTDQYDHLDGHPDRLALGSPRRLSWRECALIQTFPEGFEPPGSLMRKVELIGNAVPPLLAEVIVRGLVDGTALHAEPPSQPHEGTLWEPPAARPLPKSPGSGTPTRRRIMQGNRSSNTKPEVALRSELHRRGLRFRTDYPVRLAQRSVKVDIAFPGSRVAVFVDGCFWHSCPTHGRQPGVHGEYWQPKLERNVARDKAVTAALQALGWTVVRVWEHEAPTAAADQIEPKVRAGMAKRPR